MKSIVIMLFCVFAVACNSCTPQPSPVTPPPVPTSPPVVVVDAGPSPLPMGGAAPVIDAGPEPAVDPGVRNACDNLAQIPCAEGMNGCYRVLQQTLDVGLTAVPLACLTGAHTKQGARACGFVTCP